MIKKYFTCLLIIITILASTVNASFANDDEPNPEDRPELIHSELYKPIECDGKRTPSLEDNAEIDPRWIVNQKKTGTCYACAILPSFTSIANLSAEQELSLSHLVMLGAGKKAESGGSPLDVLENIKDADFRLKLNEGYAINKVFDFYKYVSTIHPETSLKDCESQLERVLPESYQQFSISMQEILTRELQKNKKTAAYETLFQPQMSGDVKLKPYNSYVFSSNDDHEVYDKIFELVGPRSCDKIPLVFNYIHPGGTDHSISISDIRKVTCHHKDGSITEDKEIKVINSWGKGKYNGWFRAQDFISARTKLSNHQIFYLKECNKSTIPSTYEPCVPYIQGRNADGTSPSFSDAAMRKNYEGMKALLREKNAPLTKGGVVNWLNVPVQNNQIELLDLMIDYSQNKEKAQNEALFIAVRANNLEILKHLLPHVNINSVVSGEGRHQMRILHEAAKIKGNLGIVKELLAHGADPTLLDGRGNQAIDWANSDDVIKLLEPKK